MQKQQINDNCLCSNILKDFDFDDREKIDKNRIFSQWHLWVMAKKFHFTLSFYFFCLQKS